MSYLQAESPSDVDLSGNESLLVSANTTVGNVTLSGDSFLYVYHPGSSVTLTVLGDIVLQASSTLYVNGSNLEIDEAYDVEWSIQINGSARFALGGANLTTNGYQWGMGATESANITFVGSNVAYPSGWIDTTLISAATLVVVTSGFNSDVILFDVSTAPCTGSFTAEYSIGFNVWLSFPAGTSANLTLPGLDDWQNWSFPGGAHVTGVNYSVDLLYSYVRTFAVMNWQGGNLTLSNSPDVVVALDQESGALDLEGLMEGYSADFGLRNDGFDVHLWQTTVLTWNIYPFGGSVSIDRSQIGEIQVFNGASASVNDSTLTGHGGYYGNQGTSTFSISNSLIESEVVAYTSTTFLTNCSADPSYTSEILAVGTGRLLSLDVRLSALDSYQVLGGGVIDTSWTVHANLTTGGRAASGATLSFRSLNNGSVTSSPDANATGQVSLALRASVDTVAGETSYSYAVTGHLGDSIGYAAIAPLETFTWLTVPLLPLVLSANPANNSEDVPVTAVLSLLFSYPMNTTSTTDALRLTPADSLSAAWAPNRTLVTLTPVLPLSLGSSYTLTLATNASDQNGTSPAVSWGLSFTTASGVVPQVVSIDPANGTVVPNVTEVTIGFSVPMTDASLGAAFSIGPDAPSGEIAATASVLVWTPSTPISTAGNYTITIAATAESSQGVALGHSTISWFLVKPLSTVPPSTSNCTVLGDCSAPPKPISGASSTPSNADALVLAGLVGAALVVGVVGVWLVRRKRTPPVAPPVP
ncbi:MAG: Ig-like domain-containing protein [Thermoplasmata archaeon]|nr:Ig-like domain-containing protein [Thermoplasmata archaeon]